MAMFKEIKATLNRFWSIWSNEYLNILRERRDKFKKQKGAIERQPKVDELCLLKEPGIPRGVWRKMRL